MISNRAFVPGGRHPSTSSGCLRQAQDAFDRLRMPSTARVSPRPGNQPPGRPSGRNVILLPGIVLDRLSGITAGGWWKLTHLMHEEEGPGETRQGLGGGLLTAGA